MRWVAVVTYAPGEVVGHLELRPGERLLVYQRSDCAAWLYGNKEGEQKRGVFPASFVQRVSCEDECGEKAGETIRSLYRLHRSSWLQAKEFDTGQEAEKVRQETRDRISSLIDLRRARLRCLRYLTRQHHRESDNHQTQISPVEFV